MIADICRGLKGHPGTPILLVLLVMGAMVVESWVGLAVMACLFGPVYLYGARERGRISRP